jgi:hypothetical protein
MALKKGIFESYIKERETPFNSRISSDESKYSHNRVFDEPESLKKVQEVQAVNEKDLCPIIETNLSSNASQIGTQQEYINDESNDSKGVYTPLNEKGSINPVYKPRLSTPNINPVYRPLSSKGSIRPIIKPLDLPLNKLRGNPLKITQYIFQLLKQTSEMITEKVTLLEMMKSLELSKDSARTGLRFLLKNELVKRVDFKAGKYGWSKYEVKKSLFRELEEAYIKGSIAPLTLKGSNSSNYLNNNINNTNRPLLDWDAIDITPLENIGWTKHHLAQLKSKNTPDVVQESIYHFAFGLKFNPNVQKYDDPANVLFGVLRKGDQWIETGYKSPQEIALEKLVEEKKKQQQKIADLEQELLKMEFNTWHLNLTEKEKEELTRDVIISPLTSKSIQDKTKEAHLLNYFKKNIFKSQ